MLRRCKRRFGVSVSSDLAEAIDKVAVKSGCSRSSIIELAVKSFIVEYNHLKEPHECCGLFVIKPRESSVFSRFIEESMREYESIVRFTTHFHACGSCIYIICIGGDYRVIREFRDKVLRSGLCSMLKYIPLCSSSEGGFIG